MRLLTTVAAVLLFFIPQSMAGSLSEIRLDYATYNPLSLVLKGGLENSNLKQLH